MSQYYQKSLQGIFLVVLISTSLPIFINGNPLEVSPSAQERYTNLNTLALAGAISVVSIGGLFLAHKIKSRSHSPLKINLHQNDNRYGLIPWTKTSLVSLWAWLTNEEKMVTELAKELIDKLEQGGSLADVMITRKVRYPRPQSEISGLMDTRPEFFFGSSKVARQVIHYATIDQINKPSKNAYPDLEDLFEDGKYAIYPTSYSPALSLALRWDEPELALFLLNQGADAFQEDTSWEEERCRFMGLEVLDKVSGNTPFHYAAAYKDPGVIKGILSFYTRKQQLLEAKVNGSHDLVKLILEFSDDNVPNVNVRSYKPISYGLWGKLGEATVKDGEFERRVNFSGLTPLHIAAVHGSSATVRALLSYNPDPTLKSKYDYLSKEKSIFQTPLEALQMQLHLVSQPTEDQHNTFRLLQSYVEEWNKLGVA